MSYLLIIINVFVLVLAQTLWKIGMTNVTFELSVISILKLFFTPYIFIGLVLYGLSTIMWLYILTKFNLSIVYPLQQGLTNIVMVLSALYILKENLTPIKIFGIALIGVGAIILTLK
jgi:multidrug transporter EmrE-like cation transporter